jgi:hypothetical protein
MKNVKEFCKKHKKELIIGGSLIGATVIVVLTKGKLKMVKKELIDVAGKNVISWKETGNFVGLEKVKEFIESNANSNSLYAVVKEGDVGNDVYSLIVLNGGNDIVL